MASRPAPPPPPHGAYQKASELPTGNYDIFVIPPHSAGGGFVYLPSLKPHTNSFLAGVACTLLTVGLWSLVVPVLKLWLSRVVASGGVAVVLVIVGVGVLGWAWGKAQSEGSPEAKEDNTSGGPDSARYAPDSGQQAPPPRTEGPYRAPPPPNPHAGAGPDPGTKPSWQQPRSTPATSEWERAREETRKKEEERKKKEEAEIKARQAAEKDKWDKARAREKEIRERETRERVAKERREKELREKNEREKAGLERSEKERLEREAKERLGRYKATEGSGVGSKAYQKPTAQSFAGDDDAYSYRPYDTPKRAAGTHSQSSAQSETSYAPSQSTARTTPPPSHRGPYSTKDEEKIVIDAVYAFNDKFQKATAELVSGTGSVTDGLILKLTTEGLFIDDDVRDEPQREWDVKAWTLRLIEVRGGLLKML